MASALAAMVRPEPCTMVLFGATGDLAKRLKQRVESKLTHSLKSLKPEEAAVMTLLQRKLA